MHCPVLLHLNKSNTQNMKKTFTLLAFSLSVVSIVKFTNLTAEPAKTPNGGYSGAPATNLHAKQVVATMDPQLPMQANLFCKWTPYNLAYLEE